MCSKEKPNLNSTCLQSMWPKFLSGCCYLIDKCVVIPRALNQPGNSGCKLSAFRLCLKFGTRVQGDSNGWQHPAAGNAPSPSAQAVFLLFSCCNRAQKVTLLPPLSGRAHNRDYWYLHNALWFLQCFLDTAKDSVFAITHELGVLHCPLYICGVRRSDIEWLTKDPPVRSKTQLQSSSLVAGSAVLSTPPCTKPWSSNMLPSQPPGPALCLGNFISFHHLQLQNTNFKVQL